MIIRNERKEDIHVVENLIRDAFWNVHEPGATEHYLAHQMRSHKDFVNELNMVADMTSFFHIKKKKLPCQEEFFIYSHSSVHE